MKFVFNFTHQYFILNYFCTRFNPYFFNCHFFCFEETFYCMFFSNLSLDILLIYNFALLFLMFVFYGVVSKLVIGVMILQANMSWFLSFFEVFLN